jgi:hypothetical protein
MTQLNPFVGAILPSGQAQRQQAAERAGSVRRLQELQKNVTHAGDAFEHQVESADALTEAKDQERKRQRSNQHSRPTADEQHAAADTDQEPSRLDVTA